MKRSKYENPNKAFHEPLFLEFLSLYLGLELDCSKLSAYFLGVRVSSYILGLGVSSEHFRG